jgi:hypothetical protein
MQISVIMNRAFEQLKRTRVFPLIPFAPLALLGGALALSAVSLFKVKKLERARTTDAWAGAFNPWR